MHSVFQEQRTLWLLKFALYSNESKLFTSSYICVKAPLHVRTYGDCILNHKIIWRREASFVARTFTDMETDTDTNWIEG
jgi:hypothetical protein